jgi:hypothetical protein
MRKIVVDEDVFEVLEKNAKGFQEPNDVLRVLLGLDSKKSVPNSAPLAPSDYISGKLMDLIQAGLLAPGDVLVHRKVRLERTYRAVVVADGWISTEIKRYQSPSAALSELVGSQINGWGGWVHERSGRTLRDLRDSLLH